MKPGEIWMDKSRLYWRVLDARIEHGEGSMVLLVPVLKTYAKDKVIDYTNELGSGRKFQRTTETLGWKRVR